MRLLSKKKQTNNSAGLKTPETKPPTTPGTKTPETRWKALNSEVSRRDRSSREKKPTKLPTLSKQDCGTQLNAVLLALQGVHGVQVDDTSIVAVSRLGKQEIPRVSGIINVLVKEGRVKAAWEMMGLFKPSALLLLLHECPPNVVDRLTGSKASHVVLTCAMRDAARFGDPSMGYRLLPFCSPTLRKDLLDLIPPLTSETVLTLDPDVLGDALCLEMERTPASDEGADRVRHLALKSGNPLAAARLMRYAPDRHFSSDLYKAILDKLKAVGFEVEEESFAFSSHVSNRDGLTPEQLLGAEQMANALYLIDKPDCAMRIIAEVGAATQLEEKIIEAVLFNELGVMSGTLDDKMVVALPKLCTKNPMLLDLIQSTWAGRALLGKAVVSYLVNRRVRREELVEIFRKLPYRVPISDYFPIDIPEIWNFGGMRIMEGYALAEALQPMAFIAESMRTISDIPEHWARGESLWTFGWRTLLVLAFDKDRRLFRDDNDLLHGVMFIDSADSPSQRVSQLRMELDHRTPSQGGASFQAYWDALILMDRDGERPT